MIAATPARIRITVWGLVLALVAMIALASSYQIWNAHRRALADSQAQATRFMAGAESAFNRSLLGIDVLLAGTDEFLGLSTTVAQWVDAEAAGHLLRSAAGQNLTVRFVALVDEKGKLFASSEPVGARVERELPQAFIDEAMAQPMSTLVVSAPVDSAASLERVLYFGRYIRMADGSNLLAVAEVPIAMLTTVLMQGTDIAGLEVTLERGNGQLLLGVPNQDARQTPLLGVPLGANPGAPGQSLGRARLSNAPALVVSRPLLYRDLWISASIPLDAALSKWRFDRNVLLLAALLFSVLLLAIAGFVVDYLRRIAAARLAIAQSKRTLDQALESMVSGFVLLDAEQRVVQWNRRFEEIFPWMAGCMEVGLPFRHALETASKHHLPGGTDAEHAAWVEERLLAQMTRDAIPHEQILPNGQHIEITERPTPEGGMVITYHDVSAMRRASAEIETLAFYDALTGLPNRRLLLDRLTQATAAAERSGQWGALLFLDLDHFKLVNDTMGHEVGDLLLQQVAQRLKACVRDADTVARLGGDEFVVMLKDLSTDKTHAAQVAQRIGEEMLLTLDQPYTLGDQPYRSTCSLGATLFAAEEHNAGELLKQADIAMYQVKAQRGNALCFFDPQMQAVISDRAQLEVDLRTALEQDEFELYYQPQYASHGGVVGAEALLRWRHPQRGLLAPGAFIVAAEESELIVPMGAWVLRTACQQLAAWQGKGPLGALQLSVNVSARQFRQADFVQVVTEVVQSTGITPHLLKLELTESLMLDKVDDCIDKMDQLKKTGIRFSLDDFGTGYSSLAYLTRLPLDQLKIDQSFVRNLGVRHSDGLIVQTIVGMARSLGLEVMAEGVETPAQKDLLAQYGCALYQGYLFARPAPVAQLEALIAPR
ncbi:EAL domain-containing protein [Rhodoferax sp. AJA081-3]|uniref:bifunctional diguanylate cyclase/phosphodiesterase n=1 Tax=Rhodoferax sp. AJA081-3 TaxID=2752316 RepID=UPI001AE0320F|nr:EAL domain-containing protein [Rhodoferax sp. AJA081-3]QTN27875.1 EAL domain-containing protein [Rhodoferax sp. AJA081-3]